MDTGRETGGTELATFGLELATFWPNLDTGVKGSFSENDVLVVFSPFVKVDGTVDVLDKVDVGRSTFLVGRSTVLGVVLSSEQLFMNIVVMHSSGV